MGKRVTGERGQFPMPEGRKPQLSGELKKILADTSSFVKTFQFGQLGTKMTGYSTSIPNRSSAEKGDRIARQNMLKWKT